MYKKFLKNISLYFLLNIIYLLLTYKNRKINENFWAKAASWVGSTVSKASKAAKKLTCTAAKAAVPAVTETVCEGGKAAVAAVTETVCEGGSDPVAAVTKTVCEGGKAAVAAIPCTPGKELISAAKDAVFQLNDTKKPQSKCVYNFGDYFVPDLFNSDMLKNYNDFARSID